MSDPPRKAPSILGAFFIILNFIKISVDIIVKKCIYMSKEVIINRKSCQISQRREAT